MFCKCAPCTPPTYPSLRFVAWISLHLFSTRLPSVVVYVFGLKEGVTLKDVSALVQQLDRRLRLMERWP
jgi:hypothetical protein